MTHETDQNNCCSRLSSLAALLVLLLLICHSNLLAGQTSATTDAFAQAKDAYNANRFSEAQELFSGVTGPHAQEAKSYIEKIKSYKEALETAQTMLNRSPDEMDTASLNLAVREIQQALSIKPDGPFHPNDLLAKAKDLQERVLKREQTSAAGRDAELCGKAVEASKAHHFKEAERYSCLVANDNPSFECGSDEAAYLCQEMKELSASNPGNNPEPIAPAIQSDSFAEAKKAYDNNDFERAQKLLQRVTQEQKAEAAEYLDKIARYQSAMNQAAEASRASEYDAARAVYRQAEAIKSNGPGNPEQQIAILDLEQGIDQFYSGHYAEAQQYLSNYNQENPGKPALAHFYLGASKLAQFYLAGGQDTSLREGALEEFRAARKAGFSPGGQPVSPRILQEYQQMPE